MMTNRRFAGIFSGKNRFLLFLPLLLLIGLGFVLLRPPIPEVEVNYIEVGQADSILLRSSEGKVVLIDGGYPQSGAYEYLKAKAISHIDLIVLTHPHDDHAGGLAEILTSIPVDKIAANGQPLDSPVYENFQKALEVSGVKYEVVKAGDTLPFGSLKFQVLSPQKINPGSINNNSVVMRLVVGKVSFLFTGDMQKLEEERLLNNGATLQSNILKVAHHMGDTSSSAAFVEKVSPDVAIYFAEIGNMHGFPHKAPLDTYKAYNIPVYGTDVNGTITVKTDGTTYTIKAERGGPLEP